MYPREDARGPAPYDVIDPDVRALSRLTSARNARVAVAGVPVILYYHGSVGRLAQALYGVRGVTALTIQMVNRGSERHVAEHRDRCHLPGRLPQE
jgi:hypothetical protein